jgi:hypothetical protein
MRTSYIRVLCSVPLALLIAGCQNKDILNVPNYNNPDVARTYSTPAGVEGVLASTFQQVWAGTMACTDCIMTQAKNLALEDYSELNNYEMNLRALIPRAPIINDRGNTSSSANNSVYSALSKVTRNVANGIQAVDRLIAASGATGNGLGSKAQDARAKAFGYLSAGWALGGLAMVYDSAAIVTPSTPTELVPDMSAYPDVMKAALALLDSAIATAQSPNATIGANGFPLPVSWINGVPMTAAQFVQFCRTSKARFRAGVGRTPAERAAADWNAIMADVQAGITADFVLVYSVSAGWSGGSPYDVGQGLAPGWSGTPALMYGMADTSGGYANFIATPFTSRDGAFLIHSPDLRFPQGNSRTDQTNDTPLPLPPHRYFRNRPPGEDVPVSGYGFSFYDTRRFYAIRANSGNGNYTAINKIEMDMLLAEGYIRAGNFAQATPLINASRARNGLPPIGTITSASQAIAGGAGCVPQVPQPPAFNTVACGNILEAMKWEKRMETSFSCMFICWWTDSRGWGDLPMNSGLQWPVPNQELDARNHPIYSYGGGLASSAPKGNYGY